MKVSELYNFVYMDCATDRQIVDRKEWSLVIVNKNLKRKKYVKRLKYKQEVWKISTREEYARNTLSLMCNKSF